MRYSVFMVLAGFVMIGCATTPVQETKGTEEKVETKSVAEAGSAAEAGSTQGEKTVTEIIHLVSRVESSSSGDFVDEVIEYTYEDDGILPLREESYGMDGKLNETKMFEYSNGTLTRMTVQDSEGNIKTYHSYSYDEKGNMVGDILFNGDDEIQFSSTYEYDEMGRRSVWRVLDSRGIVQLYTEYRYGSAEGPVRIEIFTPSGELETYREIEYDGNGNPVMESDYSPSGKLEKYIQYVYRQGNKVEENYFRSNKKLERKVEFLYDAAGNVIEVLYKDGSGNVRERETMEYTTRTLQRTAAE